MKNILNYAKENAVNVLDTAPSYGESETVLGENSLIDFNVITKTAYIQNEEIGTSELEYVENTLAESLKKLKIDSVYGLFVHQTNDMYKPGSEKFYKKMIEFKQRADSSKKLECPFMNIQKLTIYLIVISLI